MSSRHWLQLYGDGFHFPFVYVVKLQQIPVRNRQKITKKKEEYGMEAMIKLCNHPSKLTQSRYHIP